MRTIHCVLWLAVVAVVSSPSEATELPQSQQVSYNIHETPDDPNSPILFTVSLSLKAVSSTDDLVAWQVTEARFSEAAPSGRVWTVRDPAIETTDGLWWVRHQDMTNPVVEDFWAPPSFGGVADPLSGTTDPLDFSFDGLAQPPPAEPGKTTMAMYWFQTQLETEPIATSGGDEGPVEVEINPDA